MPVISCKLDFQCQLESVDLSYNLAKKKKYSASSNRINAILLCKTWEGVTSIFSLPPEDISLHLNLPGIANPLKSTIWAISTHY